MTEEQYIKFLKDVYKTGRGKNLSDASISKYSKQTTNKIDSYLNQLFPNNNYRSIYDVNTIEELKKIRSLLFANEKFIKEDSDGHRMYSAGLNRYIEFAEGSLISLFTDDPAILDIKEPKPKQIIEKRKKVVRDSVKISQAKGACKYCCQIDVQHKSFTAESTNKNYVEGHHIIPLYYQTHFDYSLDVLANIIVLCPNCHRLLHYAIKPERIDKLYRIYDERYDRFDNAGILIDRKLFVEMALSV